MVFSSEGANPYFILIIIILKGLPSSNCMLADAVQIKNTQEKLAQYFLMTAQLSLQSAVNLCVFCANWRAVLFQKRNSGSEKLTAFICFYLVLQP